MELLKVVSQAHGQALHEDVSTSQEDIWPYRLHPLAQGTLAKAQGGHCWERQRGWSGSKAKHV